MFFFGRCLCAQNGKITPRWFQLNDWDDKPIEGAKVLASFELVEANQALALPDIRPPTTPMHLELYTLGLRDLRSLLGVHKTFVEFELPNGKRFKTEKSCRPTATVRVCVCMCVCVCVCVCVGV